LGSVYYCFSRLVETVVELMRLSTTWAPRRRTFRGSDGSAAYRVRILLTMLMLMFVCY